MKKMKTFEKMATVQPALITVKYSDGTCDQDC